jgi:hypothetical protein
MPDWSIKIEGKPAVFTPDIDGTPSGEPLKVVEGDLVSWNNMTEDPHWPVPDDASLGAFMSQQIDPDSPSTAYNIVSDAGTIISYHCSLHSEERGEMIVVKFGEN